MINSVMLVMVEVVLVMGQPNYLPRKVILEQIGMLFWLYQCNCTAPPLVSSWSRNYTVGVADGSFFGYYAGDGRCGVGTGTIYLSSHKVA